MIADNSRSSHVGRVFRHDGERWAPHGDPLPPFDHAPPTPTMPLAPWVLPADLRVGAGDVVVVGEHAHQLLTQCADDDPAVEQLVAQTLAFTPADVAARWLASVEVWLGRRLDPGRNWPLPPPTTHAHPGLPG